MISIPLLLLASLAPVLPTAPPARIELQNHEQLNEALRALSKAHPDLATTLSVATSREGREVLALRLSAPRSTPTPPAILLVANLDGPRVYTSAMALDHARQLAESYGEDAAVTRLLDTTTLYVVPRLDVDAAEARFLTPVAEVVASGRGVDNDRDGRTGEDSPTDVNGDGWITQLRVLDPDGEWIADPTDERVLLEADRARGERGRWKVYPEGLDHDGDERVAEDSAHDAVLNRNFPRNWEEHAGNAGLFPTDEPTARGLVEFVLAHPDIALVVTYGEQGNLVRKPKSQDDGGPSSRGTIALGVYESDLPIYEELGRRYRELTGDEHEGLEEQPGSFQGWAYHHRGLISLDIDPWAVPLESEKGSGEGDEQEEGEEDQEDAKPKAKPSDDALRLAWLESHGVENAFAPWTWFDHPQLGAVEIGGFRPYVRLEPPGELLAEIAEKQYRFLLTLGEILPRVQLVEVEAKALGDGLFEITAALENDSLLPLQARAARRARTVRPAKVLLELPEGAQLLGGRVQELVSELDGAGGRHELRWLVGGIADPATIRILVDTDHAGRTDATPEVK